VKSCRRTCRISQHHFVILSVKKQMLKHTTYAILLLRIKNQHDEDDMHDMADMVQCNLFILIGVGTPDKQIRLELHFLPTNLSVD
jgi:hypothetical protein